MVPDRGLNVNPAETSQDSSTASVLEVVKFPETALDQAASKKASQDIFRWVTVNGEGFPLEAAYKDDWIKTVAESEGSSRADESDDALSSEISHSNWLSESIQSNNQICSVNLILEPQ
ncbi:hypothetical protein B0A52_08050 [Exophiala mesophila]|uniref:Uncharacterized protein n=1 Tax=Exophiala mesophila TaxID=212818 RepID=A0A438MZ26_EXOME|nr:hypothetical protein B0A52_08050 [Exophiala mesophila]